MNIHVICCNDSLQYAYVGSLEDAKKKLEKLKEESLKKCLGYYRDTEHYNSVHIWHINTIESNII